jgi:hypothetical protein
LQKQNPVEQPQKNLLELPTLEASKKLENIKEKGERTSSNRFSNRSQDEASTKSGRDLSPAELIV